MAEKDKLAKEVEEQIPSLASDVYMQIEAKLIQLIDTITPKQRAKKITIAPDPAYLALANNDQTNPNELAGKSKNQPAIIHKLELNVTTLQAQLDDARSKQAQSNEQLQIKQQQLQAAAQQQISELEVKNQELTKHLLTEQADIKLYQKEVSWLKSQVMLAKEGQENILYRFNANRDKQEKDNEQVRATIKYLRDENNDMISQNNRQKSAFVEQIDELEYKLTEYRLKFEYAQKQLMQNS